MDEFRTIDSPLGPLTLRAERPEDRPFLFRLFAAEKGGMLRRAGIPEPVVEHLVGMQFRSQSGSLRTAYAHARFWIAELGGEPVGRLVEADEPGLAYVIEIAIAPELQARGLGSAIVQSVRDRAAARGLGTRAQAAVLNGPSRSMFAKLGFVESPRPNGVDVDLRWMPAGR